MKSPLKFGNDLMDNNLHNLSVSELSGLLENKEISSLELTKEFLNKIKITEEYTIEFWQFCDCSSTNFQIASCSCHSKPRSRSSASLKIERPGIKTKHTNKFSNQAKNVRVLFVTMPT